MINIWAVIVGALIFYRIGFEIAHVVVARECRKLGGFYVGKSVFKCTEISERGEK